MNRKKKLKDLGESKIIDVIDNLIYQKSHKNLIRDDCFFHKIPSIAENGDKIVVFNSDMLVSTTDVPKLMDPYNIGRKAVIMNVSDLIVKGVKPKALIISAGFPSGLYLLDFKKIINGILNSCEHYNLEYIGGDINETKELIISPTILGFQNKKKVIFRRGARKGDYLVANGKFGLTGVGFDILLNKEGDSHNFPKYVKAIESVLKPPEISLEGIELAKRGFATSSIDSSDGLSKSLLELKRSNPNVGFQISFTDYLIDSLAQQYSEEFNVSLEKLVFNAGEEFTHIFSISPENYEKIKKNFEGTNFKLYKIGEVIEKNEVFIVKENEKMTLKFDGFEHFKKRT
jgi:thiamine-monophosphate kinase